MKKILLFAILGCNSLFAQNLITDGNFNNWTSNDLYLTKWYSSSCVYYRYGNSSNYSVRLGVYNCSYPSPCYRGIIYQPFNYVPLTNNGVTTRYHKLKFKYMFINKAQALDVKIQTYTPPSNFEVCYKNFTFQDEKKYTITPNATNTNVWQTYEVIINGTQSTSENRLLQFEAYSTVTQANYDRGVLIDEVSIEAIPSNLATDEVRNKNIKIYPNPVKNILHIDTNSKIVKGEIFSISGQIMKTFSDKEINVSKLPKGIYILKLNLKNEIITQKFIKE